MTREKETAQYTAHCKQMFYTMTTHCAWCLSTANHLFIKPSFSLGQFLERFERNRNDLICVYKQRRSDQFLHLQCSYDITRSHFKSFAWSIDYEMDSIESTKKNRSIYT